MRKMSIAREIKIQRLQNKNRMVGQTFNPGGHTSESLKIREDELVNKINLMTDAEVIELGNQYKETTEWKRKNKLFFSNTFEHNVFERRFGWKYDLLTKQTA